jgi:stage II sporulation protein R
MFKILKAVVVLALAAVLIYSGTLIRDKQQLHDGILRLHVVADSDSPEDQAVKLKVRDAVLDVVEDVTADAKNRDEAVARIQEKTAELERVANGVLDSEGVSDRATVSLMEEEFPTRVYDTFVLPAGVYDSLRIVIGSGEGHNWWCVSFPCLCVPATAGGFDAVAADAGLSQSLTRTISGEGDFQIRFLLLDKLGQFHSRIFSEK